MYVSRKNGARGLIGCENSVKSGENGLECYVKNNLEPLLAPVRTTITNEETVDPKELRKTKEEQKNEWTAKRKHGQFARDRVNKDTDNTWTWMRKGI